MEDSSEQQHPATFDSMPMRWSEQHSYPHSYHGTPAQEYTGFGWGSPPLPMHSSTFSQSPPLRPSHQQLQPLMMPWPSMLGSQQTFYPPLLPQTQIGTTSPPTMTPISAGSSSRSGPSVRKTLSDDDRRRMCKYAEENPTAKQTEIGCKLCPSHEHNLMLTISQISLEWNEGMEFCQVESLFLILTDRKALYQRFSGKKKSTSTNPNPRKLHGHRRTKDQRPGYRTSKRLSQHGSSKSRRKALPSQTTLSANKHTTSPPSPDPRIQLRTQ